MFGGLSVFGLYLFNYNGNEVVGSNKIGCEWSLGVNYVGGLLGIGVVYD